MKTLELGNAVYLGKFEQDSELWHEARGEHIGSSDISAIVGLSTYKSAYTLWHEKAGLLTPQKPDERTQMRYDYGHHMEPFVARLWQKRHAMHHVQETGTWQNKERPWQGCNPDRLVGIDGDSEAPIVSVLELKTFPKVDDWAEGPTPGYRVQTIWQLDTFGFPRGWIAGYANLSADFLEHEIEPDPFEIQSLRSAALGFMQSIDDGVPPAIDGSMSTYVTLRRLNPSIDRGSQVEIPAEVAESYLDAAKGARAAESELLKWKGHLLAHMGTAQYAVYENTKIASRVAVRDGVPYLKEA